MSDDDSKKPELTSGDLPGLSSHFSTTLTGLAPTRRKRRSTTSGEITPEERGDAPPSKADEAADPEPLTEVHDGPKDDEGRPPPPATALADEPGDADAGPSQSTQAEPPKSDPLAGIELRPGLSLVDTAEIPIHRAKAAAKLRAGKPVDPPPPQPVQNRPAPPAPHLPSYDDEPASARITPTHTSSGLGWIYVAVILLIAALIGALLFQVADLM